MNKLTCSLAISILLAGCGGGSDSSSDSSPTTPEGETNSTPAPEAQTQGAAYVSPATLATETAFTDTYVEANTADIAWIGPDLSVNAGVDYIAQAFNNARAKDPTVNEKLRMPLQDVWDSYDTSEKVLYLINSERSARGMRPFRGIAPELVNSAELYATELSENGQFSHTYGTYSTPTARLAGWAGVIAPPQTSLPNGNENATYNTYYLEELIAYRDTTGSATYDGEARAMYYFMYQDKSPTFGTAYIHRNSILIQNPVESLIGSLVQTENVSALIGASAVDATISGRLRNTLVIHAVDPNDNWDFSDVIAPPALIGPESQSDCLSGTFKESSDDEGNNTSTCQ